jgi:hypothetical protein
METIYPDWPHIVELVFDAEEERLAIRFRGGEVKTLTPVSQDAFDQFIGRSEQDDRTRAGFAQA